MTDIITEIMMEALKIFGIATKDLRQGSASEFPISCFKISIEQYIVKFLKKLAGMTDLEDALKKLDRLTQDAQMALGEALRVAHSIYDECLRSPNLTFARYSRLYIFFHREPDNTTPTAMALSRRSVYKSQHRNKCSTRGHGGVVFSREVLRRMEVYWFSLMDSRKTCVLLDCFEFGPSDGL